MYIVQFTWENINFFSIFFLASLNIIPWENIEDYLGKSIYFFAVIKKVSSSKFHKKNSVTPGF